jgi:hypothetical protein
MIIKASDGVSLYADKTGAGVSVVFIHEFAGDYRSLPVLIAA